jgi:hypothetical protein
MKYSVLIYILITMMLTTACTDSSDENVFQPQVDALEKAKDVEDKLQDAANLQRQAIEDSTE